MKQKFEQLKKIVGEIEVDVEKFNEKGNKAAGLRVRQNMLDVKVLAQDIRKYILDKKNGNFSSDTRSDVHKFKQRI